MNVREELSTTITQFLKHPERKVLLIIGEASPDFNHAVFEQSRCEFQSSYFLDLSLTADIDTITANLLAGQRYVFVFANAKLKNYYMKYQLDRWQAKVILICDASLLHPALDASIYFAPIKNNKVQRNLFTQISLQLASPALQMNKPAKSVLVPEKKQIDKPLLENHYLNQKLLARDLVFIHMLADRVQQDEYFKAFLFKLILASRGNKKMQVAAANAITVLNIAKISFAGLDLSEINIHGAVLNGAMLDHINFSKADLTDVSFQKAFMRGADLSHAVLTNVKFGEYLSLKQEKLSGGFVLHPNGEHIISGCNEQIMLWSVQDGRLIEIVQQHTEELQHIAISNNGQWLAVGDKNQVIVRHYESKKVLWKTDVEALESIAFSADNAHLLILSYMNLDYVFDEMMVVNVWNVAAAQLEGAIKDEVNIRSMVVGCDDQLITCNYGGILKHWNLKTRSLLRIFEETYSRIYTIRISADGKLLAINFESLLGIGLRIVDLHSQTIINDFPAYMAEIHTMQFSCDGNWLAFSGRSSLQATESSEKAFYRNQGGIIWLWNVRTNDYSHALAESPISCLQFSRDNTQLIVDHFNDIHFLDIANITSEPSAAFSIMGNKVLIVDERVQGVQLWDANHRRQLCNAIVPRDLIHSFIIAADQSLVAFLFSHQLTKLNMNTKMLSSLANERDIWVWSVNSNFQMNILKGHAFEVKNALFSNDNLWLISIDERREVRLWNLAIGATIYQFQEDFPPGYSSTEFKFSHDNQRIAVYAASDDWTMVSIYDLNCGKNLHRFKKEAQGTIATARFSDDARYFYIIEIGKEHEWIFCWDLQTGKLIKKSAWFTEVSADGQWSAIKSQNNIVSVYRLNNNSVHFTLPKLKIDLAYIAFSQNSKMLAVEKDENSIEIWDIQNKKHLFTCLHKLREETDGSASCTLRFVHHDKLLLLRINDQIQLWDARTGKTRGIIAGTGQHAAISVYDDNHLLTLDQNCAMLWEHQDNHAVDWLLVWALQLNQLYASNLDMTQAQGLSDYNYRLLLQKHATGQPAHEHVADDYHKVQLMNFYRQGLAFKEKGDDDNAIDTFQKCNQLNASYLPAFGEIAWCWLRKSVNHKKYLKQAEKIFHWIKNESDPVISVRYALFLIYQNRFEDAVNWLQQCVLLPQCNNLIFNEWDLDCLYEVAGLIEEIQLRKSLTIESTILAYYILVMVYIQLGEDNLAIEALRQSNVSAISLLYDQQISAAACSLLGRANKDIGDEAMANAWFAFAMLLNPAIYNHNYEGYRADFAGWKISQCVINLIEQWLAAMDNAISIEPKNITVIYYSILKLHLLSYILREGYTNRLNKLMSLIGEKNEPEYHPIISHILARCYHMIFKRAMKDEIINIQKSASLLAHNFFLSALKNYREVFGNVHSSFCLQYGIFLIHIGELNDAIENLELAIALKADESDVSYSLLDKDTAWDDLHFIIEEKGTVNIKASLLAYSVLIDIYPQKLKAMLGSQVSSVEDALVTYLTQHQQLIAQLSQDTAVEAGKTMNVLPLQLLVSVLNKMGSAEAAAQIQQSIQFIEAKRSQLEYESLQKPVAYQMQYYQQHGLFGDAAESDDDGSNALEALYNNDPVKKAPLARKK